MNRKSQLILFSLSFSLKPTAIEFSLMTLTQQMRVELIDIRARLRADVALPWI